MEKPDSAWRSTKRLGFPEVTGAVAVTAAAVDQVTKWLVAATLNPGLSQTVLPGLLDLSPRANPHGAFGLFASLPPNLRLAVLLVLGIMAMFCIVLFSIRTLGWSKTLSVSLGLVLGGALSNLTDRALRGEVLDFVDMHLGDQIHWPIFNLADVAISLGSIMLMGSIVQSWVRQKNRLRSEKDT